MSAGSDLAAKGGQTGTDAYAQSQALAVAARPRQRGGTGAAQGFDSKHPRTAKGRTGGGQFAVKAQQAKQSGGKVVKQPRTPAEIAAFQKSRGLPVTGKLDSKTATAIRNAQQAARQDAAAAAAKAGAKGTRGSASRATAVKLGPGEYAKAGMGSPEHPDARVTGVQRSLDKLGYDVGISGVFGVELTKAVRLFQENNRLPVTGVVDNRTRRFIEVKLAKIDAGKASDHAGLTADTPGTKRNRRTGNVKSVSKKGSTGKVAVAAARSKRERDTARKQRPGGGQQAAGSASKATRVVIEAQGAGMGEVTEGALFTGRLHPRDRAGRFRLTATASGPSAVELAKSETTRARRRRRAQVRARHRGGEGYNAAAQRMGYGTRAVKRFPGREDSMMGDLVLEAFDYFETTKLRLVMEGRSVGDAQNVAATAGAERFGADFPEMVKVGRELFEAELADAADELLEAADSLAKASSPSPLSRSKTSNWVARSGGLPAYIQHIAKALMKKRGKSESQAVQMAIGIVKRWARGGGDVDAGTRAAATKALAEWEALKAKAHAK